MTTVTPSVLHEWSQELRVVKAFRWHVRSEYAAADVCVWSCLSVQHWAWEMLDIMHKRFREVPGYV